MELTTCQINWFQGADNSILSQCQDCEQLVSHLLCTHGEQNAALVSEKTIVLHTTPHTYLLVTLVCGRSFECP